MACIARRSSTVARYIHNWNIKETTSPRAEQSQTAIKNKPRNAYQRTMIATRGAFPSSLESKLDRSEIGCGKLTLSVLFASRAHSAGGERKIFERFLQIVSVGRSLTYTPRVRRAGLDVYRTPPCTTGVMDI